LAAFGDLSTMVEVPFVVTPGDIIPDHDAF
jgi:hypothetical protein